jgi:exonuclease VII small subunit
MFENKDDVIAKYFDASAEFGKSANELLQHINLLPQALSAYQQAMTASAELRKVLDSRDETLRALMTQLEQAVSSPFGKPGLTEKKLEPVKAAAAAAGGIGVVKTFP